MKKFFSNKKLIGLLMTVILFITVLSLSFNRMGNVPFFQTLTNDITAVFGRMFETPIRGIDHLFGAVNNLQNTYTENQRLKKEIDRIGEVQAENQAVKAENKKLKEQLDLQATLSEYKKISGTVIARNPDGWLNLLVIDRGSTDGLKVGMSVLGDKGLIGRVTEVNPTSAKVMLLTNEEQQAIQTSAEVAAEDDEIVHGLITRYDDEREELVMDRITSDATVKKGTKVISSGLGGIVPRGLLIGEVSKVTMDEYGLSQRIYVTPAADFDQIRFVTIVGRDAETTGAVDDDHESEKDAE